MFNKKPKVEFFCLSPDIAKIAPIIPANKLKPNWFNKATEDFVNKTKDEDWGKNPGKHTAKCPGIFNLIRYGWVLTTWQDIVIETNGDGQSFNWHTPIDQTKVKSETDMPESVGYNPKEHLSDFMGGWEDSLNCVIRIQTPWRVIVPDGYYLLESPVPYADDDRFTTLPGFLSNQYGVSPLNVQLKWHVLNGKTLIKAGTPISHYMLVPMREPEMICKEATKEQLEAERITNLEHNRRYVSDRSKSKCIFSKMFSNKR